ncbi:MAG TPA: phosphatase PAP2 family protein [Polyangiaceae bacterium]|jgi:undecaprenyl-diphosphatase
MARSRSAFGAASVAVPLLLAPVVARADEPQRQADQHFTIDPVSDITLTGAGAGVSALLSLILSTGEIKPLGVSSGDSYRLLSIDRIAVTQTIDPHAALYSDIGLYSAVGFAVLDSLLSSQRDGWDAALVDAVMYAESISLTEALTDVTKIAVRRPRPIDYINCGSPSSSGCSSTDLELSFFSGHAATVGDITATATYLAFVRSPHTARPWITLGVGTALTAFVSYERVRSGNHFPTDVVAGALAGAAIGVLVPHLHRHGSDAPPVWIGLSPVPQGGAVVTLQGLAF